MTPLLPMPDVEQPPSAWPPLVLLAATILLEAEGEAEEGQIAVGYVILYRVENKIAHLTGAHILADVILSPYQFTAFNADAEGIRRARLMGIDPEAWDRVCRVACGVWWGWLPNPVPGCGWYLNPALTRELRGGTLPGWYQPEKVVATIGQHDFLRA